MVKHGGWQTHEQAMFEEEVTSGHILLRNKTHVDGIVIKEASRPCMQEHTLSETGGCVKTERKKNQIRRPRPLP